MQKKVSPLTRNESEAETRESLLNKMRKEQEIMRSEALQLQEKAEISRHRRKAGNKQGARQSLLITRHSGICLCRGMPATEDATVTKATRVGLKVMADSWASTSSRRQSSDTSKSLLIGHTYYRQKSNTSPPAQTG